MSPVGRVAGGPKCPKCGGATAADDGGPCDKCWKRLIKDYRTQQRAASLKRQALEKRRAAEKLIGRKPSPMKRAKDAARRLPLEKRQSFLDAFRAGGKSLGEVRDDLGLTTEEAAGIIELNTVKTTTYTLREKSL